MVGEKVENDVESTKDKGKEVEDGINKDIIKNEKKEKKEEAQIVNTIKKKKISSSGKKEVSTPASSTAEKSQEKDKENKNENIDIPPGMILTYQCPKCNSALRYIDIYDRYWCDSCLSYPAIKNLPPPQKSKYPSPPPPPQHLPPGFSPLQPPHVQTPKSTISAGSGDKKGAGGKESSIKVRHSSSKPTVAGALMICGFVLSVLIFFSLLCASIAAYYFNEKDSSWFGMARDTVVAGQVFQANGTPLEGATVTIRESGITTTTDVNGTFIVRGVKPGIKTFQVSASGYITVVRQEVIQPDDREDWDVDRDNDNDSQYNFSKMQHYENYFEFTLSAGTGTVNESSDIEMKSANIFLYVCTGIYGLLCVLLLAGAISSMKRTNYGLALIGAIAGIFLLPTGTIFSIIALFVLLLSREDFM
ncbi:MAG: carboxypeptidase-like regulatory domain-containing protein [Thermoplasmata archaeon]